MLSDLPVSSSRLSLPHNSRVVRENGVCSRGMVFVRPPSSNQKAPSASHPDRAYCLLPGPCSLSGDGQWISGGLLGQERRHAQQTSASRIKASAEAGAGTRSREKRPARNPPLLVKIHS